MLASEVGSSPDASMPRAELRIDLGDSAPCAPAAPGALEGDSFDVSRQGGGAGSIVIRAGTERGLIHAASNLLEKLGADFPPGVAPSYPRVDSARVGALRPWRVTPAFKRRAFVSDIMTWNYNFADRLDLHLRHDREFIPWMARRGINAFSYIRHAHDTRLKIDEIAPLLRERGIDAEYGGHVLQLLLPRDRFAEHPEYFPAGDDAVRIRARQSLRLQSRCRCYRPRGRARLRSRASREPVAAHLGRRRTARRVVPMRPMPRDCAAGPIHGCRQCDCRRTRR